ncbi:Chagasin family peptidase inhibitor I42 [Poriferisphaera corsica]|uniref:Chagasin family peptidase inhibitor I42 n=1 Tax=Poriferisphaera corsica TaxID=2528020 RepID=A0A517YPI0_9BACT|nr:protease inhibitor I42 family protein [Poriferisphaera corsica]QDU32129.1 Chagasin family peptidase inhibitor I42 [Poriferisphaera corsica]
MAISDLRIILVAIGVVLWASAMVGCQEPYYPTAKTMKTLDGRGKKVEVVSGEDNGALVYIKTGESLHVRLRADPTTGFLWTLSQDRREILAPVGRPLFEPDEDEEGKAVGTGGIRTWIFLANKTGLVNLKFIYHRPYEKDEEPMKVFRVTVNVVKGETANYPVVQEDGEGSEHGRGRYY